MFLWMFSWLLLPLAAGKGVDAGDKVTCFSGSNKDSLAEVQSLSSFQSDSCEDNGKTHTVTSTNGSKNSWSIELSFFLIFLQNMYYHSHTKARCVNTHQKFKIHQNSFLSLQQDWVPTCKCQRTVLECALSRLSMFPPVLKYFCCIQPSLFDTV